MITCSRGLRMLHKTFLATNRAIGDVGMTRETRQANKKLSFQRRFPPKGCILPLTKNADGRMLGEEGEETSRPLSPSRHPLRAPFHRERERERDRERERAIRTGTFVTKKGHFCNGIGNFCNQGRALL